MRALVLLLLLVACSGPPERTRYELHVDAPGGAAPPRHGGPVMRVYLPRAGFGLESDRIQIQTNDGHIASVTNAAWVEPLPKMLQPLLMRAFEGSGKYGVIDDYDSADASLELRTSIERFTIVYPQQGTLPHVEVALRMELAQAHGHALLRSHLFTASVPVGEVRMRAIVPAFDRALGMCLSDAAQNIRRN